MMVVGYLLHFCSNGAMRRRFYRVVEFTNFHLVTYCKPQFKPRNFDEVCFNDMCERLPRKALHIDRRGEHISSKVFSSQGLSSCYETSVLIFFSVAGLGCSQSNDYRNEKRIFRQYFGAKHVARQSIFRV